MMYTVTGTLAMNGIDVRRWLGEWLNACADNGREAHRICLRGCRGR